METLIWDEDVYFPDIPWEENDSITRQISSIKKEIKTLKNRQDEMARKINSIKAILERGNNFEATSPCSSSSTSYILGLFLMITLSRYFSWWK